MRWRQIVIGLGVPIVVLAVTGTCSSVPTPSTSVPTPSTSAEFGSLGGALTFPDGGSLDVPPGALDGSVTITASTLAAPNEAAFATVGPFYQLLPESQSFDAAVTVRLPIPGFTENDAGIERWAMLTVVRRDSGAWDRIPSWVDPETASVVTLVTRLSPVGAAIWQSNACAATSACPSGGVAFCVMGQLVVSVCGASGTCVTSVLQDCRVNGMRCVEGVCVAGDAGTVADAGTSVIDAGVAMCGCGPSDITPDGGRLVVGDAGCNWGVDGGSGDADRCSGWHSAVVYQNTGAGADAGLDQYSTFQSGTEFTYGSVTSTHCNIKILCP
jgi:hypothetical protein